MNIIEGRVKRPYKIVIYGPEGIGKSTMASKAEDALFIDLEAGTDQMNVKRVGSPRTWEELITTVKEIAGMPDICKSVVIDTADRCEVLCAQYICRRQNIPSIESLGYGKGYTILQEQFQKLLNALDTVIASGKNVIVAAHAKMRKQELPDEAGAFDRWEMKLTRQVAPLLKEWTDALLFLNYKTFVVTTADDTRKAQGGRRVIYTSHHPCWDAKNRHELPEVLNLDAAGVAELYKRLDGFVKEKKEGKDMSQQKKAVINY